MTHARIIWIAWRDSMSTTGWDAYEPLTEFPLTYSSGILVEEAADHYTIAHSFDPETQEYNGLMRIPFCAVEKARTLCTIQMTTK